MQRDRVGFSAKTKALLNRSDVYGTLLEELEVPQYGRVYIVIKPLAGETLSNVTKTYIKKSLDKYRVASLDLVIVDADILNIEVSTTVLYDDKKTLKDNSSIAASARAALTEYGSSTSVKKFGGAVRYSRVLAVVDVDVSGYFVFVFVFGQ